MRLFSVVAATLVLGGMPAAAQDGNHRTKQPTPPPPIYVKHTEVTMLVTKGEGHRTELNQGYTTIGEPHPIKCVHDQGCVVTAVSMVEIGGYSGKWAICTLVDGVPRRRCAPTKISRIRRQPGQRPGEHPAVQGPPRGRNRRRHEGRRGCAPGQLGSALHDPARPARREIGRLHGQPLPCGEVEARSASGGAMPSGIVPPSETSSLRCNVSTSLEGGQEASPARTCTPSACCRRDRAHRPHRPWA